MKFFNKFVLIFFCMSLIMSVSCTDDGFSAFIDGMHNPSSPPRANPPPEPVTDLTAVAVAESSQVALSWVEPTDGDFSHVLIRWEPTDGETQPARADKGTLTYTVSDLMNTVIYTFFVTTLDRGGNENVDSVTVEVNMNDVDDDGTINSEDVDDGNNGLIDISTATMLDNMQYDLAGTSYKTSAGDMGKNAGCPEGGCNGYELTANIDLLDLLDANNNGMIDTVTKTVAGEDHTVVNVSVDTSWSPVGDNADPFTGTFEGNGNTIANLWVNISSSGDVYAGLFGVTGGSAEIRNVGVISGGVFSSSSSSIFSSYSGGLVGSVVGSSSLTITNSYFSGEGSVSSSSYSSGGLVGSVAVGSVATSSSLTIMNSYFSGSGGVSSSSPGRLSPFAGGLVGLGDPFSSLTITNSYFSGSGGVSSSSTSTSTSTSISPYSGGLVGLGNSSSLTITNSYFSGSGGVSSSPPSSSISSSYSGGLVGGSSNTPVIMNSYWNTDAPQLVDGSPQNPKRVQGNAPVDPMGAVGLILAQLQATSGTFPDLGDAWDLGTDQQLPAVKQCILDMAGMGTCASYGALLDGQQR